MWQDWLHASTLQTRNTYMFTEFHSTLSNYTCSIQHKTISLLFFRHCLSKKLININPFDNRWVWERYLVKAKGAAIEPGRQTWQPCELHPAATITLKTSVEKCADIYHKTSRGKEELGTKAAKSTARERNIQGVKWLTSAKALYHY